MRLVLTADKVVVRQGERFGIGATLQNVSGRAIRHNFRTFEHICEVVEEYFEALKEVDDPSPAAHRRANPAGWIRRPARSFTAEDALDPFPSIRFISSRYSSEIGAGMSVRDAYGATASRPGVYRIRLEWSSDYSDDPAENFWKGTLRSNDVVIDVRPNRELDDR
jgi:hypothetical protein